MTSNSLRDNFDLSKLDERVKVRHQAVKKTQVLLRLLSEWRTLVQPIVDDNIVRNRQLGRAATLLPAHRIPALVDLVSSMAMPLEDLTRLIQHATCISRLHCCEARSAREDAQEQAHENSS
jgi:hypothetical protein